MQPMEAWKKDVKTNMIMIMMLWIRLLSFFLTTQDLIAFFYQTPYFFDKEKNGKNLICLAYCN